MGEEDKRITTEIIRESLAQKFAVHINDVEVLNFKVEEGIKAGENFNCVMKAVEAKALIAGEEKKAEFMVKVMPMSEQQIKWLTTALFFRTEADFYSKLKPSIDKILKNSENHAIPSPQCYFANEEAGVIVMENLKPEGYTIMNKAEGLDIPHVKMVLELLAKFHATSYHFLQTYYGGLKRFLKDYWPMVSDTWIPVEPDEMPPAAAALFDNFFEVFKLIVEDTCSKSDPELVKKVNAFSKIRNEKMAPIHVPSKDGFNCIVHNDSWCNNFMFKHDKNGIPVDIKVVDMQLTRRARPMIDLAYCLGSSTSPETRSTHLDELLHYYHGKLTSILDQYGYSNVYPYTEMKKDFDECFLFGIICGNTHAQIALVDNSNPDTFNNDMDSGDDQLERNRKFMVEEARRNDKLRNRLIGLAKEAEQYGYF